MSETEIERNDLKSWTTVRRKKPREKPTYERLRPEQERTVLAAEQRLTPDERERIQRRSLSRPGRDHTVIMDDHRLDPRNLKGKGPDPRNWGAIDASDDELDIEAQRAALASWNTARKVANESESDQPGPSRRRRSRGARMREKDRDAAEAESAIPSVKWSKGLFVRTSIAANGRKPLRRWSRPSKLTRKATLGWHLSASRRTKGGRKRIVTGDDAQLE